MNDISIIHVTKKKGNDGFLNMVEMKAVVFKFFCFHNNER